MMSAGRRLILATVLVALGAGAWILREPWRRWWQIDACLDAGGSWNHRLEICEQPPHKPR
jgi:hypothetical protein